MSVLRIPQLRIGSANDAPVEFVLPRSKSESNRMLVLQALAPAGTVEIRHLSEARDTVLLRKALRETEGIIDVQDAGTAMRFATAYHALRGHRVELRGTDRMHLRPIGPLVEALRSLGASITYLGQEGFPPLRLEGFEYSGAEEVVVDAALSSQFITALMLCAPALPGGLRIRRQGTIVSGAYTRLTAALMKRFGIPVQEEGAVITVLPGVPQAGSYTVEPDWSAAGYAFSLCGLTGRPLQIPDLRWDSAQGDVALHRWYQYLGVGCWHEGDGMRLQPLERFQPAVRINFTDIPDQAQTFAVYCAARGIELHLSGVSTLKIKETDRIEALRQELQKVGCNLEETDEGIYRTSGGVHAPSAPFSSHDDHRMAMSLAPLAALFPIEMEGSEAVAKSFPDFWEELKKLY